nr:hypothetical protein [Tanacetum cinerariifolium]
MEMDSIIPLGQKNTLAEYMILSGADNCPPMLDKDLVSKDLWERVQLIMQGDDPIACLNKEMAFLTAIASSRVTVQQVHRRQGQSYSGTGYKSNATSSRGNNASELAKAVKCYNCQDPGVPNGQVAQTIIPNNDAF